MRNVEQRREVRRGAAAESAEGVGEAFTLHFQASGRGPLIYRTRGVIGGTGSNERSVRRWKSTARLSVGKSGDAVEGEDGLVDAALVGFDRAFELFALAV